jgi:hypothetical protein
MCNHLGIQHATMKQIGSSKMPGRWAGSVIFSHQADGVIVIVTQEKWAKTKRLLDALVCELDEYEWLDFKSVELVRGFLMYVSRTYWPMIPFLLGTHHTLDSWRPNRVLDGWRQIRMMMSMEGYREEAVPIIAQVVIQPQIQVRAAKHLSEDLHVLNAYGA